LRWFLGATLAVAGCSSPDPKLYTIATLAGSAVSGGPKIVSLLTVRIARYLQRSQIVQDIGSRKTTGSS